MFLVVPESYVEQMEILSGLGGSKAISQTFKDVKFITSTKKEEVKVEPINETKKEEVKTKPAVETKKEEVKTKPAVETKKEEVKVEPDAKLKPVNEDTITMSDRKVCPIQIKSKPTTSVNIDISKLVKSNSEPDEGIEQFKVFLDKEGIKYSNIKRKNTGLVELILPNSMILSVDINDRLYGIGRPVAFIGKIKPLDEYSINHKGFILNSKTVDMINKNKLIDDEYLITNEKEEMYRVLDINTLNESNFTKRTDVLNKAVKSINLISEDIKKCAAETPVRFAFTEYKSIDDFKLTSSSASKISSLCNDTLRTNKVINITVKGNDVTMTNHE